jgi:hypothetical protein
MSTRNVTAVVLVLLAVAASMASVAQETPNLGRPATPAEIAGKPNDPLVGGQGTLTSKEPVRTIGSYWPYATTVFDYVRRAMPYTESKSLTNEEVYAVTAYLLHLNGIIGPQDVMNAQTLPQVKMPNRDNFIVVYPTRSK